MPRTIEFDRDEVVHSAMQLFWRKGYRGTSVQSLVDATGVERGSLYNTFGSKRELFLAALDRYVDDVIEDHLADLEGAGSPLEGIRRLFGRVARFSAGSGKGLGCLVTNSCVEMVPHDAEMEVRLQEIFGRMEEAFEGAITRARDEGEIDPDADPEALAAFLMNTLHGLRLTSKTNPDPERIDRVVETALSTLT